MMAGLVAVALGAPCPTFRAEVAGHVAGDLLSEASGLVASGRDPEVLWSHNDSGDTARIMALTTAGEVLSTWDVEATAIDWEDIARRGGELLLGDIGDNRAVRASVSVWVVAEPDPRGAPYRLAARQIVFRYPGGPRDAEVLLADPSSGAIYVVSKGREKEHAVYRVPEEGGVAERLFTIPFRPAHPYLTAGDVAHDGSAVVLRGYTFGWWYPVPPGAGLLDGLKATPCPFPTAPEAQGEAVATTSDGRVFTLSEHRDQPLWRYRRLAE